MTSPLAQIQPLQRERVSDQLARRLLDLVARGSLKPGDSLESERDLAVRFGVSRPTVREALRALSIMGVLNIRHGGGVTVTALDGADVLEPLTVFMGAGASTLDELFEARARIEAISAELAATRIEERDLARLGEIVTLQRGAPHDADLFHDTDIEFHRIITQASGNSFFVRIGQVFQVLAERGRRVLRDIPGNRARSITDHADITAALSDRDPDAAHGAMRAHLARVRSALRQRTEA